jgi:hypothetical protein
MYDENATEIGDYVCFRDDRINRIGGGVALWIRSSIVSCVVPCNHSSDFECAIVKLPALKIIIMALYLPPNIAKPKSSNVNSFVISALDDCLMHNPGFDVVIAGDLNRFDVKEVCCSLGLRNINNRATYANSELDYILLSVSLSNNYTISLCAPFDRSKVPHKSLLAVPLNGSSESSHYVIRRVYDLRSSFIENFVKKIDSVDWSFLENPDLSLNAKCSLFQGFLEAAASECIPVSFVKCSASDKPWITTLVKDLINKRWRAFRKGDYATYNCLKIKIQSEIQKAKFLWTKKMQHRDIWKAVRSHLGKNSPSLIMSLLSQYTSTVEAADAINAHLFSVFVDSDWSTVNDLFAAYSQDDVSRWMIDVSPCMIQTALRQLSRHKSSPDLPNILYKSVACQLSAPLSKLLELSFELGLVPEPWKRAVISPIPKTRNPTIKDIRPISLLPPLAKIMERVVLKSIKCKLLENYDNNQFGFRPNSSTQCALAFLHNQVTDYLDDPSTFGVMIVSYDYSKAFDRLRFDLIIKRMIECKFPSRIIAWMIDYLMQRTQVVRIGEVESRSMQIVSGVPQGSILGPFLYSFATATYCPMSNNCHVIKYADDTSLIFPLYKSSNNDHVSEEHKHLLAWSVENDLEMNVSKCKALIVRKSNVFHSVAFPFLTGVQYVDKINILGVFFNCKFTWTSHIDYIIKKCSRLLFAFRIIRGALSSSNLNLLYCSLVRSIIEYCSPVYIGLSSSDARRLEYLQKRFHRLICSSECNDSCLSTVTERRLILAMKFLDKVMKNNNHVLHKLLPPKSKFDRFILPPRRTERRSKSFFLCACEKYNRSVKR